MKSIFAASMLVSLALLLSRVSGFVREVIIAARLGASEISDGAILMLTLPDFMVGLLLAGGLNAAFVPALKSLSGAKRKAFFFKSSAIVFVVFLAISLLVILFAPLVINMLAPDFDFHKVPQFHFAFAISMMSIAVAALIGVTGSFLNSLGKFAVPGLSVLAFNLIIAAYIAFFFPEGDQLVGLGIVIFCAAMVRLFLHTYPLREQLSGFSLNDGRVPKGFARRLLEGTGAFSIIVGVPILFRSLHALSGDGYLTLYNYSHKLFELPAAMLISPVVLVLLPKLSAMFVQNDDQFLEYVKQGLFAVIALACVALGVGYVFMDFIVEIVFGRGAMTSEDLQSMATTTRVMLLALPFYGVSQVAGITLNAMGRTGLFFILSLIALFSSIATYLMLGFWLPSSQLAPFGFFVFSAVLGLSATFMIFPVSSWSKSAAWALVSLVFRLILAVSPFFVLLLYYTPETFILKACLISIAAGICLPLIVKEIKPLLQMRVDAN